MLWTHKTYYASNHIGLQTIRSCGGGGSMADEAEWPKADGGDEGVVEAAKGWLRWTISEVA